MKQYEDEILELLESEFGSELSVERFPSNIKDYVPSHQTGSICVTFTNEQPDITNNVGQASKVMFVCSIVYRCINSQYEVYSILDRVRNKLNTKSWKFEGSSFFDMKDGEFWVYHANFSKKRNFEFRGN